MQLCLQINQLVNKSQAKRSYFHKKKNGLENKNKAGITGAISSRILKVSELQFKVALSIHFSRLLNFAKNFGLLLHKTELYLSNWFVRETVQCNWFEEYIGAVISNLVRKFFRGRMRGTVVRSAGNSLKVVTYVHNGHCLAALFLETCGVFNTNRFLRFVAIDLLLSHADL